MRTRVYGLSALAGAILIVAAGLLLGGTRQSAEAQATSGQHRYQVAPLAGSGWVVIDTHTGSMEQWLPTPNGFAVRAVQFGGYGLGVRIVGR